MTSTMTSTSIPVSSSQHPFIFSIYLVQSRNRKQRTSRIRCTTQQDKLLETHVLNPQEPLQPKHQHQRKRDKDTKKMFGICACPKTEPKYRRRRNINHRKAVLTTHLRNRNTGCTASYSNPMPRNHKSTDMAMQ